MAKKKLGEILLEAGAVTRAQLSEALEDQKRYGGKLGNILLERRFITEKQYFNALTSQLNIPAIDFTKSTIPEEVIKIVPRDLAENHNVFPVGQKHTPRGKVLLLAMGDPTDVTVIDEVTFITEHKVEPVLALDSTLRYVIRDYYYHCDGRGSYRLEYDMEIGRETEDEAGPQYEIVHSRISEPSEPTAAMQTDEGTDSQQSEKPRLSRELRALLKLLAKKGIITSKEYLEAFKDTD